MNGRTRTLLICGILAGPLYVVVGLIEIAIRPGFDITRHPLSLMSLGDLGWIQIANFLVTGSLVIAGAAGMRRAIAIGRGRTWGPLLVGVYGLGLVAAAFFSADPMNGFPPGTPAGMPATISWHALLQFVSAAIAFFALIAACFVFARRFASERRSGWAAYSVATGVFFFAAFVGNAVGAGSPSLAVAFAIAIVLGWTWISAVAARLAGGLVSAEA